MSEAGITFLSNPDRVIRGKIKEILHLAACMTDHLLYSQNRDGGIGDSEIRERDPSRNYTNEYQVARTW